MRELQAEPANKGIVRADLARFYMYHYTFDLAVGDWRLSKYDPAPLGLRSPPCCQPLPRGIGSLGRVHHPMKGLCCHHVMNMMLVSPHPPRIIPAQARLHAQVPTNAYTAASGESRREHA